jgi:hypothetical protein
LSAGADTRRASFLGVDVPLRIEQEPLHERRFDDDRVRIDGTQALITTYGILIC